MCAEILNVFTNGMSGSNVYLAKIDTQIGVLKTKIKHVDDIIKKHSLIPFDKPQIYWYTEDSIFMEYIPGVSVKQYLKTAHKSDVDKLISYICNYFDYCFSNSIDKNYHTLLLQKSSELESPIELDLFNTVLPCSVIHGDFTFDNLLYYNDRFYMIDIHSTPFDSIHFDANKLRQDITSGWFIRNEPNPLLWQLNCNYIYKQLDKKYPYLFNDEIYKFMLLRILPYCSTAQDRKFVITEIEKLCK